MEKEGLERAVVSAEKQSSYFRLEQVALRSALDELNRMRDANEVDEALYEELREKYSQRLSEISEKEEQFRKVAQSIRRLTKYDKEIAILKEYQQELSQKIAKAESKLEEERSKILEIAERFGLIGTPELKPAQALVQEPVRAEPERRPTPAQISAEAAEVESEVERLRKEILSELEKARAQSRK
ncbi:hypothetical protein KEJ51_06655 [Candidatus Bathyarchaeota archaeon]|nr:hypothetical protein [Candidatus Bathyarchaeota archaeon]MBS7629754.1 hypothetical protein [Candidatus Bathyarchaeota archaeon]